VVIDSSSPQKKIVACFHTGKIAEGHHDYLWEQFWKIGYAIQIYELEEFDKPANPYAMFERFVPLQSFCYVDYPLVTA